MKTRRHHLATVKPPRQGTLQAIRAMNYQGWVTIELYPYVDDPDDAARTATKAREAIAASSREDDDMTVYQSLGLLGLALLDLHQDAESIRVLDEIHKMVAERRRIVVGDRQKSEARKYDQMAASEGLIC